MALGISAALTIGPATDATNGWWHDPQGWLLLLVPPAVVLGMLVGTWAALRLRRHERRLRTLALMPPLMLLGLALTWVSGTASVATFIIPQVAAVVGARVLATRHLV